MKDESENMPDIDQELHERLCAYVFGELQGAERAAFEAELLRSPELQRERQRLESTIGLVKRAVPDEGLSSAVRCDLVAAARRSRFRFVRGRTLVRVAAAAVLILGSAFAVRMFAGRGNYPILKDTKVAQAPAETRRLADRIAAYEQAMSVDEPAEAKGLESLKGLGYGGDADQSVMSSAEAPLAPEVVKELCKLGYSRGSGGGSPPAAGPAGPTSLERAVIERNSIPESSQPVVFEDEFEDEAASAVSTGPAARWAGASKPSAFVSRRAGSVGSGGGSRGKGARAVWTAKSIGTQEPVAPPSGSLYYVAGEPSTPSASLGRTAAVELAAAQESLSQETIEDLEDLGYGGGEATDDRGEEQDSQNRRRPVLTREQVAVQVQQLLDATQVAPGESASAMFFRYWGDAPFLPANENKTSTFAVDVDTASYALARAYLNRGELPPREAVRTEEFVNYFKADQPAPGDGKPFAIGLELAPSPFAQDARTELLRVTVRGQDVQDFERKPLNLTFVIDNSGSMREGGRLELVKRSLALLLRQLHSADSVAVVKFSDEAAVVTAMLPASRRGELEAAIQALPIEGGTNVEAGLRKGYELALESLARHAVNRVVLCSDGVGNIGETSARGLLELVKDARAKGIYLNTVGVGMGNHNDAFLEELADKGDGVCNYVDSDAEAKRVFVDGLASLVQPIARDVKIQVEFDPAQVESWRLLGYENRALRAQDFRDDKIDAGEVNAGHQVTALYELVRLPSRSGSLATVRVRYKTPFAIDQGEEGERARAEAEAALEIERTLASSAVLSGFAAASNGYQRAALVAQFAEVLRQSVHARGDSFATLLGESRRLEKALGDPDFSEFVALLGKANPLLDARTKEETPRVQQLLDELSKLHYEKALRERKRELAVQAREPAPSADEMRETERIEQEASKAIERLDTEVRDELLRTSGIDPALDQLRELGYAK